MQTVLVTKVTMLHIVSPWLVCFIAGRLYILTPFTHFTHSPLSLWQPPICSPHLMSLVWFGFLDSTYKQNNTYCCKWQDFILFYGWVVFHCTSLYHIFFLHHFHILAIVLINNAATNTGMNMCFLWVFSFSLDKYPEVELPGHLVVLFLIFWETSMLFSLMAAPISIPTSNV